MFHAEGLSDYGIAKKLKMEPPNVTRSRKNALKKLAVARADLEFVNALKIKRSSILNESFTKPTKES